MSSYQLFRLGQAASFACALLIGYSSFPSAVRADGSGGIGGKELQAHVSSCPDTRTSMFIAPILGGLAAATASNLAGTAIDAIVVYLTKDRAKTSEVSLPLEDPQLSGLFGNGKCLYVYLDSQRLHNYLKASNIQWGSRESPEPEVIHSIRKQNLTPFFAVISFVKPRAVESQEVNGAKFFRPNVLLWHYDSFIDPGCPLFRSCNRRDVVIKLEVAYPRDSASDGMTIRSIPIAVGFSGATAQEVGNVLTKPNSLGWFSFGSTAPQVANLRFSVTETSKPGALANAIGSSLQGSKQEIQETVQRYVYTSPSTQATLQATAFDEYKKYIELYNSAKSALAGDISSPESRNTYKILRSQALTQLQLAKTAWSIAKIDAGFSELAPLPTLP